MDTIDTTLVAAVIAACAALAAAALGLVTASRGRRLARRSHAWDRITWAVSNATSDRPGYDISRTVLQDLASVRWLDREERTLAGQMARVLEERRRTGDQSRRHDP
jgi:hypothetical protein